MSSFSEANFLKKLSELNPTQQSIQTFSLWLIHHRKHAKVIVETWMREIRKVKPHRKLTFLYLANDVIQNSKKKGPEFNREFKNTIVDAYKCAAKDADSKTRDSMDRMLNIWKERNVFDEELIEKARIGMMRMGGLARFKQQKAKELAAMKSKQALVNSSDGHKDENGENTEMKKSSRVEELKRPSRVEEPEKPVEEKVKKEPPKKKKKVELSLREEIELEMRNGPGEPPEAEDLVKALNELENSASSDASVRERIAALPPEVSDVTFLEKLKDKQEAQALSEQVESACRLLSSYNSRLAAELQERKRVARMLRDYIVAQKDAFADSERKLQDFRGKLEKVDSVRRELNSHLQSLPDLTLLPDLTAGLAPLPSAGDLFNLDKPPS